MVVDTSAIIAILEYEVEADQFAEAIQTDPVRFISAATLLECAIVIEARHGQAGGDKLDQMLHIANIQVEPVTAEQITAARLAFRTYGKGRHPAALNFGDCFSYALAKIMDQPLLFKGNDFSQTDVRQV